jgi:hypothetical protein
MSDRYYDNDNAPSNNEDDESPEVEAHVVEESLPDDEAPSWCVIHNEH